MIVVAYQDRLDRFGMEHLEAALATHDRPIVASGQDRTTSDLVQDMIDVPTGICAPLYGRGGFHDRALQAVTVAKRDPAAAWTVQAYRFALDPTPSQEKLLAGHCHAARTAFNVMLAAVKANRDQRAAERSYGLGKADLTPALNWSAYELRRQWNLRKQAVAPWWAEYSKEAYASGCANLAAALANWDDSRRGRRAGRSMRFPKFKSRHRAPLSCVFTTGAIRVEPDRHHVTLPVIGTIKTHESTRTLARRLEAGTARITTATIRHERGRWFASFTTHVHRSLGRPAHAPNRAAVVGVDLGVRDLLVAATPDGQEVARIPAPNPLKRAQRQLQALQRKAARQYGPREPGAPRQSPRREPSQGWQATQAQIRRLHARAANLRADALHKATTALSQQHRVVGVETLAVANMARRGGARKRGLNRSLYDASLGAVALLLGYKTTWYGSTLIKAARWFPSSKTCSSCGAVKAKLGLHERAYHCERCGLVIDRDLNAAINLARHALAQTMGEIAPGGSGPLDSGGADRKTPTHAGAGGNETATLTGGAASAAGGTAPPQGEAA
jgi:putative transposase